VVAFGTVDQVAMVGLGLVLGAGICSSGRSRWTPTRPACAFRNVVASTSCPGRRCAPSRFDRKSPWASLLLRNGDEVALLAVQAVDKERAVRAVEGCGRCCARGRTIRCPRRCSTTPRTGTRE
jgi:hypothetical protein